MHRTGLRSLYQERTLLLAGFAGLAVATAIACGDSSSSDDAGAAGSSAAGSSTAGAAGDNTAGSSAQGGAGEGGASGAGGSNTAGASACVSDPTTAAHTAAVVSAAGALLAALTIEQQSAIKYDKTLANAQQWSNFPTTFVQRNGVRIGDMSAEAQAAAVALASVAAGPTGATLLNELREADEFLVTDGKASSNDYGRGLYYFSIHGDPSTSAGWMLQIAGHHLAYNFTYNGKCTSATPLFDGAEPMDWTDGDEVHSPLEAQRSLSIALIQSISSMADAKLSGTFNDLVNGPAAGGPPGGGSSGGNGDAKYPSSLNYPTGSTGRGVLVSTLSEEQKQQVKVVIESWVKNVAAPVANVLLASYESDEALAQTYVAYAGSIDLSTQGSYIRIDGPRVWIEDSVQGGIVYKGVVHHHTIWRDKVADYGADYISQ